MLFPRLEMKRRFSETCRHLVVSRPETSYDNFLRDFANECLLLGAPFLIRFLMSANDPKRTTSQPRQKVMEENRIQTTPGVLGSLLFRWYGPR